MTRGLERQRGSITAEAVVLMPALLSLVALIVYAGRLTDASNSLYRATDAGARAASQTASSKMEQTGTSMAMSHLRANSSGCTRTRVSVSRSSVGRFNLVTVRARCIVTRSGLGLLILPRVTVDAESTEVIDYYTQR